MSEQNPYRAPSAAMANEAGEPRHLPAGRGWRWLADGFEHFRRDPLQWVVVIVVFFVINVVIGVIPIVSIVGTVIAPIFSGGMMLGCAAQRRGEGFKLEHLFSAFSGYGARLALLGLLSIAASFAVFIIAAIVMVIFGLLLGFSLDMLTEPSMEDGLLALLLFVLVVLALLMPLLMALWFAPCLVIFDGLGPWDAMQASFFGCLANIVPFLVYGVVSFVFAVVASIPLFLGLLVLMPVIIASVYCAYLDIYRENRDPVPPTA